MKHKILVTGGTGFIGSHTAVELINSGYEVLIIDNLSNSNIEALEGIEKITGVRPVFDNFDLCDNEKVNQYFAKHTGITAIIHFAAFKAIGESMREPLKYYKNNVVSLLNILEAMTKYKVNDLVFSSSCSVYGQPDKLPVTEQSPMNKALSQYGNTKQMAEEIIQNTIISNPNIRNISLRYFNPIGAHETTYIGELPIGVPNNLIPFITQTAIGIREQLSIFGGDYPTPDGSCLRDYIDVVDLAKAHVIAVNRLLNNLNKKNFEVFNIGAGCGISVFEIVKTFEKVTGEKVNFRVVERRPGDAPEIWAETSLANTELGWKAEKTLEKSLLSAWKWEKYIRSK